MSRAKQLAVLRKERRGRILARKTENPSKKQKRINLNRGHGGKNLLARWGPRKLEKSVRFKGLRPEDGKNNQVMLGARKEEKKVHEWEGKKINEGQET